MPRPLTPFLRVHKHHRRTKTARQSEMDSGQPDRQLGDKVQTSDGLVSNDFNSRLDVVVLIEDIIGIIGGLDAGKPGISC